MNEYRPKPDAGMRHQLMVQEAMLPEVDPEKMVKTVEKDGPVIDTEWVLAFSRKEA